MRFYVLLLTRTKSFIHFICCWILALEWMLSPGGRLAIGDDKSSQMTKAASSSSSSSSTTPENSVKGERKKKVSLFFFLFVNYHPSIPFFCLSLRFLFWFLVLLYSWNGMKSIIPKIFSSKRNGRENSEEDVSQPNGNDHGESLPLLFA